MAVASRAVVLIVVLVASGCGSGASGGPAAMPPASAPPAVISASPTPAQTQSPSPTPVPTPSATPTLAPTPSPLAIGTIFHTKAAKVSSAALLAAQRALYSNHPEFEHIIPLSSLDVLAGCLHPGLQQFAQPESCVRLVDADYRLYSATGIQAALDAARLTYDYALGLGVVAAWIDGRLSKLEG